MTAEIEDTLGDWLAAEAKRFQHDSSYRPTEIKSRFGIHGCLYGRDEDDREYVTIGFNLPQYVFAEIEDGTYGRLQGFRIYVEPADQAEPEEARTKVIELPCFGMKITLGGWDGNEYDVGEISSDLHDSNSPEDLEEDDVRAALDTVESLVLAHAVAGIDVTTLAYIEGIETAVNAIEWNIA